MIKDVKYDTYKYDDDEIEFSNLDFGGTDGGLP